MTSDIEADARPGGGSFFPPSVSVLPAGPASRVAQQPPSNLTQRVADVRGLSRAELRAADGPAMAVTLQGLWGAMKNRPVEKLADGEVHPDGTPRIGSQVAVWLIGRISEAYGRPKLVNLSRVKDVEALRSLGGLAGLLVGVIEADTEGTMIA